MRLTAAGRTIAGLLLVLAMSAVPLRAEEGAYAGPPDGVMEPEPGQPALTEEPRLPADASPRAARRACAEPERTLAIGPAETPLHIGLESYPQTLRLRDHEVVLTFDDGPSPKTTPRVLDALHEACAHATFFLIGRHTAKYPALAQREFAEGHTIGHHSDTHPTFTLRGFDQASAENDINAGVLADERALYGSKAASPKHPHTPFFRFPGFADTGPLLHFLDERQYTVFGTDMWAKDWVKMTPDFERRKVLGLLEAAPHHNGIILFHDTIESTAQMLPDLLADLRERGYKIVHVVYDSKALRPPLEEAAPGWTSETEAIIKHLRKPIVEGSHHAGETATAKVAKPGAPRDGSAKESRPAASGDDSRCGPACEVDDPTTITR